MHQLLYINWDPDPTIFGFFSWYGLLFASSFAVGYWIMTKVFKLEGVDLFYLDNLTIYMGLSTVIGARLGHCFFYDPAYYLAHPLEILMIWKGGLASHGAAIGIITGMILWSRFASKRSVWWILDRIVIMVALSGLFIRTGNLVNSEILGSPTESAVGFVFPRADQSLDFRAKWVGNDVELKYIPAPMEASYFSLFRYSKDSTVVEVPGPLSRTELSGQNAFLAMDRNAGKAPKHYWAVARGTATTTSVAPIDSNDTRRVDLSHEFNPGRTQFSGEWKGNAVKLHFQFQGLDPAMVSPLVLLRSTDGTNWKLLGRGTMSGNAAISTFDTLDVPPANAAKVTYRILEKQQEIHLVARHASMMYEAIFYTLAFAFLLWLYFKKKGRIEHGLLFGLFLVLIFGWRFVIEFLKEDQEAFSLGLGLNMGQLLSIPFVLVGVFCIFRAMRIGVVDHPPFPPVPEKKKKEA